MTKVIDSAERQQALNPLESFIVQAPAGSGKTELLTQRFLRLLVTVAQPEEVLAITFTRKAAAEMRDRILAALQMAQEEEPEAEHQRSTWRLAKAVLEHNEQQGWGLLTSPSRLRVLTIDGLCSSLVRQMPVLSSLGGSPSTVDDARPMFQQAAEQAIKYALSSDVPAFKKAATDVLLHFGGGFARLAEQIAAMLGKRDQWARYLLSSDNHWGDHDYFASAIRAVVEDSLSSLDAALTADLKSQIADLCLAAANHLEADNKLSYLSQWREVMADEWPQQWTAESQALPLWLGVVECLLTGTGGFRKRLTKAEGFPPGTAGKALKEKHAAVCEALSRLAEMDQRLAALRLLPNGAALAAEVDLLPAIALLLRQAVAQLKLLFAEHNQVDHAEVTQMALDALGEVDAPTDLALALDYRIKHILADEVQDTSHNQFELFRRLTAGWELGDGRSFFAVGDPMQSIYRFREADVGLFLQAWQQHLRPGFPLTPIRLAVNFRSQQGIVDWVNRQFKQAFPQQVDIVKGAIPYAESTAFHPPLEGEAVHWHIRHKLDEQTEAEQMLQVIGDTQQAAPESRIAVLARGRSHLAELVSELRQAGISYRAIELESLGQRPVVSDLMQLTRAIMLPADRLAWLSILRSPVIGLALADLLALLEGQPDVVVLELLRACSKGGANQLSAYAQQKVEALIALWPSRDDPRRLCEQVEQLWFALGGPALVTVEDMEAAELYLQTLALLEADAAMWGRIDSLEDLERAVEGLYAPPVNDDSCRIELMTMHKSKGLQFDVVLLPQLHRSTRAEDKPLLCLEPLTIGRDQEYVLLAPEPSATQSDSKGSIYGWLHQLNKDKTSLEKLRLFYVAATRAKQRLHLFASLAPNKEGKVAAPKNSLLASVWDSVATQVDLPDLRIEDTAEEAPEPIAPRLLRMAPNQIIPRPPESFIRYKPVDDDVSEEEVLTFDWADPSAMLVGTVLHEFLQVVAEQGLAVWQQRDLSQLERAVVLQLRQHGLKQEKTADCAAKVLRGLRQALDDPQGQWVLGEQQEAVCEYAFQHCQADGRIRQSIIDRSFVADGVRWVVDYKTGDHGGGGMQQFIQQQRERYTAQLQRYGDIYAQLEQRPIKLALYFPLLRHLESWDYVAATCNQ